MAGLSGTVLASKIVPTDSLDTYATHDDKYGRGGHRSADTIVDRDAIPDPRRKVGMTVYVIENDTTYYLKDAIGNINWALWKAGVVEDPRTAYELALVGGYVGTESEWITSLHGQRGLTGFKGDEGEQGIQGDRGPAGPIGPKGDTGTKGDAGTDGIVEFNSLTSIQLEMIRGLQGNIGLTGAKGDKGDTGGAGADGTVEFSYLSEGQKESLVGATGSKGDIGLTGLQGVKGDKGDRGVDGNVAFDLLTPQQVLSLQGIKGDLGNTGPMGPQGPQGPRGLDGNVEFTILTEAQKLSLKGDQGIQGIQGNIGPQGVQGNKGNDGDVAFDSLTPLQITMITGPQGEQGPLGLTGLKGDKGDIGPTGSIGLKGSKGDQGIKGDKGDTGSTGIQGIPGNVEFNNLTPTQQAMIKGDKGDIGLTGLKGDKGEQGIKGIDGNVAFDSLSIGQIEQLKGNRGDRGVVGETGPTGPFGPQGEKGDSGPIGPRGLTGVKGDAGDVAFHDLTVEQIAMITGNDAYELALSRGFVGTLDEWLESIKGTVSLETLTDDQVSQLQKSVITYGNWTKGGGTDVLTMSIGVTKVPIFTVKTDGALGSINTESFLCKKDTTYMIDFSVSFLPAAAGSYSFYAYNDNDNTFIPALGYAIFTPTTTTNHCFSKNPAKMIRFAEDTNISIRLSSGASSSMSIYPTSYISITEIDTIEMKLVNFKINGKTFDDNNNISLEGVSTLSNPQVGIEVLTEFRHPVTGKPLYTKTINIGALPNIAMKSIAHGVVGYENMIIDYSNSYLYSSLGTGPSMSGFVSWTLLPSHVGSFIENANILIITGENRSSMIGYITVKYTKIADTSDSPVRLVGSIGLDGTVAFESLTPTQLLSITGSSRVNYSEYETYFSSSPGATGSFMDWITTTLDGGTIDPLQKLNNKRLLLKKGRTYIINSDLVVISSSSGALSLGLGTRSIATGIFTLLSGARAMIYHSTWAGGLRNYAAKFHITPIEDISLEVVVGTNALVSPSAVMIASSITEFETISNLNTYTREEIDALLSSKANK